MFYGSGTVEVEVEAFSDYVVERPDRPGGVYLAVDGMERSVSGGERHGIAIGGGIHPNSHLSGDGPRPGVFWQYGEAMCGEVACRWCLVEAFGVPGCLADSAPSVAGFAVGIGEDEEGSRQVQFLDDGGIIAERRAEHDRSLGFQQPLAGRC